MWPNSFRLDQLGRNGGAIDRHERAVRPLLMRCRARAATSFAGAGLATEQHGGRRWRDALEPLADLDHQFRLANHALDIGGMGADFPAQHEVFLARRERSKQRWIDSAPGPVKGLSRKSAAGAQASMAVSRSA